MLRGILQQSGWKGTILVATTSEEAMEVIERSTRIDCAFIDYYIPSHNGPSIIHHLRSAFPESRIALVSSADNAKNAEEAQHAGADSVVCSTFEDSEERLKNLVQGWMMEKIA